MAEKHTSGDGRENSYNSLLDPEVYVNNASAKEDPEDQNLWPRHLAQKWILVLFMGTCMLYCARMAMPICAVSMALSFHWSKIDSGLVLGGFYWGYCLTQIRIIGGSLSTPLVFFPVKGSALGHVFSAVSLPLFPVNVLTTPHYPC